MDCSSPDKANNKHIFKIRTYVYCLLSLLVQFLLTSNPAYAQTKFSVPIYIAYEDHEFLKRLDLINSIHEKIFAQRFSYANTKAYKKDAVVLAVGFDNLVKLIDSKIELPILAIGVSSSSYRELAQNKTNISAIYADPSPETQLRLISLFSGTRDSTISFIYSSRTEFLKPVIQTAASTVGNVVMQFEKANDEDELYRVVNRIQSKWILAYPDKTIYSPTTVKNIMPTLYKNNQSIIGFSKILVGSGAIASAYPTDEGYALQTLEIIQSFLNTGKLPAASFPKYTKFIVNASVAKAQNFVLKDELKRQADVIE